MLDLLMDSIKALLVGCKQDALIELRREFGSLTIEVERELPDIDSCLAYLVPRSSDNRIVVVDATTADELKRLHQVKQATAGLPILAIVAVAGRSIVGVDPTDAIVGSPWHASDLCSAVHRLVVQVGYLRSQSRTVVVIGATERSGCTTLS